MQRGVALAAALIMVGNIVSRLLGLVREQVMAALFGATGATDAFVAASAVPMIVYDLLIGGAVSAALVPVLVDHLDDRERFASTVSSLLTLAAGVLCAVSVVLAIAAPAIVAILGGGFDDVQRDQAVSMVRLMLVAVVFQGLAGVLMAVHYAEKRFAPPAFAPAMYNGGIIVAALTLHTWLGVQSLVLGVILGAVVQLGLQLVGLRSLKLRPTLGLQRPEVRLALRLYAPVAMGMIVTIIGIVIDRHLASLLQDGSMTVMSYATRLIQFPLGLVGVAIASAILPTLSEHASAEANGDATRLGQYRSTLVAGTRLVFFLMLPALIAILVLRDPLVSAVFERGRFTGGDTARTSLTLLAYAPQLPFTALDQLLIVAFYARKDTRTPVIVGVITVLLYVVTAVVLIGPLDVAGLALANAVQNSAHGLILLALIQRKVGQVVTRHLFDFLGRLVLASAAMTAAMLGGQWILRGQSVSVGALPELALLGAAAILSYVLAAALLRLPELKMLLSIVRR